MLGLSPTVTKLKGFAAWDAPLKNQTWLSQSSFISLQQVKKMGFTPKALPPGREA